jgi:hypothetical protein
MNEVMSYDSVGSFMSPNKKVKLVDGRFGMPNVMAILENVETGKKRYILGSNIVTNSGDQHFAALAAGEAEPFPVSGSRLGTGTTTPVKTNSDVTTFLAGSGVATDSTYPKTSDDDSDNSTDASGDVVTYRMSYTTSDGNGNDIAEMALVNDLASPTKALNHALFAATFNKTSSDTLKLIVNLKPRGT